MNRPEPWESMEPRKDAEANKARERARAHYEAYKARNERMLQAMARVE